MHWVTDGKKQSELPIADVRWSSPELEVRMAVTGVVFRGTAELGEGLIRGRLYYGDEAGPETILRRTDPGRVPGLRARPAGAPDYTYSVPNAAADGWATAECGDHGLPPDVAEELVEAVVAGDAGVIHSLLLVAGGELVVEEYFHGYGRNDLHRLASTTKSVSSLLVGIAIDTGLIDGIDAPLLGFFPDLELPTDERWRSETLHHLLSMSMGLDWGPDEDPHGTGPDFFQQVLDRRVIHEPGTHWAYHSANVNLLAGVIHQASGLHADEFAERYLFGPLGITDYDWSFMEEAGYRLMDGSLALRPRDMAKLGMLLRDEGRWQGTQVISADWIQQSVTPHMSTDGPADYGYLWWVGTFPGPYDGEPVVYANGLGSQFIAYLPERDLVIVVTGGNEDNGKHFAFLDVLARALE